MSDDEIEQALSMTSAFTGPIPMALYSVIGSLIFSLIVGLLVSLGLKTR